MTRRVVRSVVFLILAAALALAWRSDRILFDGFASKTDRYFKKIGHALRKHDAVQFFMPFDEPRPVEWIRNQRVTAPGTELVDGQIGKARHFDGEKYTYIETQANWTDLGDTYTLSLWIKLKDNGADQNIWFTGFQKRDSGIGLSDGNLIFSVPDDAGRAVTLSYPFSSFNRFTHIAAVVTGPNGEARLYENGKLKAHAPVTTISLPNHNMEFGISRWYVTGNPMEGAIDEAVAWSRALTPAEISALAHTRRFMPRADKPALYWRWRLLHGVQAAIPRALKMIDRFNPFLFEGSLAPTDLPEIQFLFSGKDGRFFVNTHDRSLAAGRRVNRGANPRRIQVQYDGTTVDAQLQLGGSDTRYPDTKRPLFILQLSTNAAMLGSHYVRFVPPEAMSNNLAALNAAYANRNDADRSAGLCRLAINGRSKGIYYYEAYAQLGLAPGAREDVTDAPNAPNVWWYPFRGQADESPTDNPTAMNAPDDGLRALRKLLSRDTFNPWSSREWRWRIRLFKERRNALSDTVTAFALLGDNPAPDYIITNLNLSALRRTGLTWHSTRPDIINDEGQVTRPDAKNAVSVEFVATSTAEANAPQPLRFRVMPQTRTLPALMIYCREKIQYHRRTDFRAFYYPAGKEGPPLILSGSQETDGGIKQRGNTSFWRSQKKPLSLRFDAPQNLIGAPPAHHLYLLSGYVDTTKLRNKFVYDLFREWGAADKHHPAPMITWAEVFINGRYFGVWEMCSRMDGAALGLPSEPIAPGAALYKVRAGSGLFAEPTTRAFNQVYPRPGKMRYPGPINDLVAFTSLTQAPDFAREIEQWLDLENAIDFFLILNFAENVDGRTTNFFLSRDGESDPRFFFIPWDYDHTFEGRHVWLSNHLFDRLFAEYPAFENRVAARWHALRRTSMTEEALDQRIARMADLIAPYMTWEDALYKPEEDPNYAARVEAFRDTVHLQLKRMDARFSASATH